MTKKKSFSLFTSGYFGTILHDGSTPIRPRSNWKIYTWLRGTSGLYEWAINLKKKKRGYCISSRGAERIFASGGGGFLRSNVRTRWKRPPLWDASLQASRRFFSCLRSASGETSLGAVLLSSSAVRLLSFAFTVGWVALLVTSSSCQQP